MPAGCGRTTGRRTSGWSGGSPCRCSSGRRPRRRLALPASGSRPGGTTTSSSRSSSASPSSGFSISQGAIALVLHPERCDVNGRRGRIRKLISSVVLLPLEFINRLRLFPGETSISNPDIMRLTVVVRLITASVPEQPVDFTMKLGTHHRFEGFPLPRVHWQFVNGLIHFLPVLE